MRRKSKTTNPTTVTGPHLNYEMRRVRRLLGLIAVLCFAILVALVWRLS